MNPFHKIQMAETDPQESTPHQHTSCPLSSPLKAGLQLRPGSAWAALHRHRQKYCAGVSTTARTLIQAHCTTTPCKFIAGPARANTLRRGVYHGQDANPGVQYDNGDVMAQGGRRSKRPRTTTDASNPLVNPITPLQCSQPGGRTAPLHHCDIVFMTYEALRKELSFQTRRARGSCPAVSVAMLPQRSGTPHGLHAHCTARTIPCTRCFVTAVRRTASTRRVHGAMPAHGEAPHQQPAGTGCTLRLPMLPK